VGHSIHGTGNLYAVIVLSLKHAHPQFFKVQQRHCGWLKKVTKKQNLKLDTVSQCHQQRRAAAFVLVNTDKVILRCYNS